jgi:lipoyl(octanoyl) transferase
MPLLVRDLGRVEYQACFEQMQRFTAARDASTPDELWVVEHPPVYTLGLAADPAHLWAQAQIAEQAIPVVQTDRGGEVTYHGPGQVVIYLLLDLRRRKPAEKFFVRELVYRIEQAIINLLAQYGVPGERKHGAPGIYLAASQPEHARWHGAKIAALGLKVKGSGCTYHGLSLNVAMDLRPFSWINPCGYAGLATIDLRTLGIGATLEQVQQQMVEQLETVLAPRAAPMYAAAVPAPASVPEHVSEHIAGHISGHVPAPAPAHVAAQAPAPTQAHAPAHIPAPASAPEHPPTRAPAHEAHAAAPATPPVFTI